MVRRRHMVRNYQDRPLPPGALDRILANAARAPSAGFTQGWAFLVLEGPKETGRFWDATLSGGRRRSFRWQGLLRAPAVIVALSDKQAYLDRYAEPDKAWLPSEESQWPVPYWHVDTGFAALLMLLTAVDEGLGALFFAVPPRRVDSLRTAFGVPDTLTPIGAVALGYPAPDEPGRSRARGRRPLDEVVHRGRW